MTETVTQKRKKLLYWVLIVAISYFVSKLIDQPKDWFFQILPTSIFKLDRDMWYGLTLTFGASLLAWISGVVGGYFIGLFVASAIVERDEANFVARIFKSADKLFDYLYIIPLVLTLSLCYAMNLNLQLRFGFPRSIVAFVMIAIAGLTLGGYHVYKSIYESVLYAKRESRYLTEGLFFRGEQAEPQLKRYTWQLVRVNKLLDCEILQFCNSIPRAFHLSVVAVIILESITLSFYELIFPQSGAVHQYLGGVGKLILTAQQNNEFQAIAGCVWVVLFFDTIVIACIEWYLKKRYQQYYTE